MEYNSMYLLGIVPLVLINVGLVLYCLADWLKRRRFKWPGKWGWLVLFACFQFIGPLLYILIIRSDDNN